jgi:maltose/moltooligosaccharide transporter
VGNRGLGASEGQLLGSVPGDVVKNATCDVLIVQTSALDEDRLMGRPALEGAADATGSDGLTPNGRGSISPAGSDA